MSRRDIFLDICARGDLIPVDALSGWPGVASFRRPSTGESGRVSLHAAPVAPHRRQRPNEIKIEPPSHHRPVVAQDGHPAVVVGHSGTDASKGLPEVFIAFSGHSRIGNAARWNVTFFQPLLQEARITGWATYDRRLSTGRTERLHAFAPGLLPTYLDVVILGSTDLDRNTVDKCLTPALPALATATKGDLSTRDLIRRDVAAYARKRGFSRAVLHAYDGLCAFCGLGLDLVEAAHILPVESGVEGDVVSNGIAACHHHHAAFDYHRIYIDPDSLRIKIHPSILAATDDSPANKSFIQNTAPYLAEPSLSADRPRAEWFKRRYEFYAGKYDWAMSPQR